jgi:hypothetical protein
MRRASLPSLTLPSLISFLFLLSSLIFVPGMPRATASTNQPERTPQGTKSTPEQDNGFNRRGLFESIGERPQVLIYAYPLDYSFRYDKNEEQDYRRFDIRVLAIGLEFKRFDLTFEVSHFDNSTQSGSLSVAREQQEYHFWGRASLWRWNIVGVYGGLAMGSYDETIKTTLSGSSVQTTSQWNWSTGIAAGVNIHIHKYLLSAVELRSMFGKDFDPQPQFGGLLRIGVRF